MCHSSRLVLSPWPLRLVRTDHKSQSGESLADRDHPACQVSTSTPSIINPSSGASFHPRYSFTASIKQRPIYLSVTQYSPNLQYISFYDKLSTVDCPESPNHRSVTTATMSPSLLLHPPGQLSPAAALYLSQQAPAVLQGSPTTVSSSPLSALFSAKETPELWLKYENLLLSCLRTGDEQAAHQCLERLVTRFGDDNERIMAFKGLLKEADAQNNGELDRILKEYEQILSENETNIVRQAPALPCPSS